MNIQGITSLGTFIPIREEAMDIEEEFRGWLLDHRINKVSHLICRVPATMYSALDLIKHPHPAPLNWHKDHHFGLDNFEMIIWASHKPTEILTPNNEVVSSKPYEVIKFNNAHFKHRTPEMHISTARKRMFIRVYVK